MQMLELNGLQELNQEELVNIDGGDIIDDAWAACSSSGWSSFNNTGNGNFVGVSSNNQYGGYSVWSGNSNGGIIREYAFQ